MMRCVLFYMLKSAEGDLCLLDVLNMLDVLDVPEVMRSVLLRTLEVVRSMLLCVLEVFDAMDVSEVIRCVLLCMLEVFDAMDVSEVIRCVLLCMLEAVEGRLCLLEVMEAEVLEVIRCVLLCMLDTGKRKLHSRVSGREKILEHRRVREKQDNGTVEGDLCLLGVVTFTNARQGG